MAGGDLGGEAGRNVGGKRFEAVEETTVLFCFL